MEYAKENFSASIEMLDLCLKTNGPHVLSCGYGYRKAIASAGTSDGMHPGIDKALSVGTKIYAPFDGEITATRNQPSYGLDVFVYNASLGLTFFAGHLSQQLVKVGQKVSKGDLIAYSGNTGMSTGPHIHAGLYKGRTTSVDRNDSKWVDPVGYVLTSTASAKKSNDEVAKEVWDGKWGNGADRVQRLTAAGYDANAIQAIVNKGVTSTPTSAPKTLTLPASLGSAVPVYSYADGKKVGTINPKKFGGLTYDLVTITGNGDRVIVTRDYGKVRVNPKYGTVK
ncbi:hypothetical protein AOC36_09485 [Erysipelothrix larvae]|uniref:Cpl-7 lysozyme C-terminal domain-containing protein n=1 Tax=Erysipelothrix larvae TaxID=1514105 RepID=A0A0X8H1C3_9FIRM|nr:peptidoglycan DD-metalloendopeptidase family protein [Erysipelothrix larvae]AMC94205.1 hypothetical protein AOC36_09485 [Erysipelothrix larvae]